MSCACVCYKKTLFIIWAIKQLNKLILLNKKTAEFVWVREEIIKYISLKKFHKLKEAILWEFWCVILTVIFFCFLLWYKFRANRIRIQQVSCTSTCNLLLLFFFLSVVNLISEWCLLSEKFINVFINLVFFIFFFSFFLRPRINLF